MKLKVSFQRWREHAVYTPLGQIAIVLLFLSIHIAILSLIACNLLPADLSKLGFIFAFLFSGISLWVVRFRYRLCLAAALFLCLSLFGWWGYYESIFGPPAIDTYMAVFQADLPEALQYSGRFLPSWIIVLSAAGALAFPILGFLHPLKRCPARFQGRMASVSSWTGVGAMLVALAIFGVAPDELVERVFLFQQSVVYFRSEILEQERMAQAVDSTVYPKAGFTGNIILVLGEATTRRHMGVYGYFRDTTPHLDARKKQLLIHTDTISPHSHTTPAVPTILTGVSYERSKPGSENLQKNLVHSLRQSGVKTFWYSNQNEYGFWVNPVSLIAKQADVWFFLKKLADHYIPRGFYDEFLLPRLDEALRDPAEKKFIVLHFSAAHDIYCAVIPEAAHVLNAAIGLGKKYFGDADDLSDDVNCYDNAIRYVDGLLERILSSAERSPRPTAVIFIADHGEHPGNGTKHNSGTYSPYHVEIPNIWYFNPSGKIQFRDAIEALRFNLSKPFISTDLFHTILDLAATDRRFFNPERSWVSRHYRPRPRRTVMREYIGDVAYDDLSTLDRKDVLDLTRLSLSQIRRQNPDAWKRLWAHRVDTLGALQEAKQLFAGVELDVVFHPDESRFYVYHPPKPNIGLSLEEYLAASNDRPDLRLWLDWKNANPSSFHAALGEFIRLDAKFSIRKRANIETGSDAVFAELSELRKRGFSHSYYLPSHQIKDCSMHEPPIECETLAFNLLKKANTIGATAISFDHVGARFVMQHRELFSKLKQFTWNASLDSADRAFSSQLQDIGLFEGYLIKFHSLFSY